MAHDNAADTVPTPGVIASGGAYRATVTGDGGTWRCPHVHFTQQSAKACAERHVSTLANPSRRIDDEPTEATVA